MYALKNTLKYKNLQQSRDLNPGPLVHQTNVQITTLLCLHTICQIKSEKNWEMMTQEWNEMQNIETLLVFVTP